MEAALERLLASVETLVADLDALDDDPDLEPSAGSTSPGLSSDGWSGGPPAVRRYGRKLLDIDDAEHDGKEPDDDGEHELGWSEGESLKGQTGSGSCRSQEDDVEHEPSLGSSDNLDQRRWSLGGRKDLEEQCEDEGGACEDEGYQSDDEGHGQAPCHHFYDEGRQVWPPAAPAETPSDLAALRPRAAG